MSPTLSPQEALSTHQSAVSPTLPMLSRLIESWVTMRPTATVLSLQLCKWHHTPHGIQGATGSGERKQGP